MFSVIRCIDAKYHSALLRYRLAQRLARVDVERIGDGDEFHTAVAGSIFRINGRSAVEVAAYFIVTYEAGPALDDRFDDLYLLTH